MATVHLSFHCNQILAHALGSAVESNDSTCLHIDIYSGQSTGADNQCVPQYEVWSRCPDFNRVSNTKGETSRQAFTFGLQHLDITFSDLV